MNVHLRFADPATVARLTRAKRGPSYYRGGECPNCGHRALKIARGDDGHTMLECHSCRDWRAIVDVLRGRGWTTTPGGWEPKKANQHTAKVGCWNWGVSAACRALTLTEIKIDSVIYAIALDQNGLRHITQREIGERAGVRKARVVVAMRALKRVGRWEAVRVPFPGVNGRLRWRHAYREGQWWQQYAAEDGSEDYRQAKEDAREARHYRLRDIGQKPTQSRDADSKKESNTYEPEEGLHTEETEGVRQANEERGEMAIPLRAGRL
jgi:hypothetical protein